MKKQINFILIYLLLIGCVNAQEKVKVVVENRILVSPDIFVIKIASVTNQVSGKEWMKNMNYITRDSTLEIIEKIPNVKRITKKQSFQEKSISEYLNIDYFEVYGIESYQILRQKLSFKTALSIEETKLKNLKEYEEKLIKNLIKESREKVEVIAEEKGKNIEKMIEYKEMSEIEKKEIITQNEDSKDITGFGVLKEKFIEFNHKGYTLDKDGKIILHKRIEVTWKIN